VIGRGDHLSNAQALGEVVPEFGHEFTVSVTDDSARKSPICGPFKEGGCLAGQDSASLGSLAGNGECRVEFIEWVKSIVTV